MAQKRTQEHSKDAKSNVTMTRISSLGCCLWTVLFVVGTTIVPSDATAAATSGGDNTASGTSPDDQDYGEYENEPPDWSSYYAACPLCTDGADPVHPHAYALSGSTCGQIDRAGRAGQYSDLRCGFLRAYLQDKCCHDHDDNEPTMTTAPAMSDAPSSTIAVPTPSPTSYNDDETNKAPANQFPGSADRTYISVFSNTGETFSLEDLGVLGLCFASIDGVSCDSCASAVMWCMQTQNIYAGPAFVADCSNVNVDYQETHVCYQSVFTQTGTPFDYSDFYSQSYSSGNQYNNNDGARLALLLILRMIFPLSFALVVLVVKLGSMAPEPPAPDLSHAQGQRGRRGGGGSRGGYHGLPARWHTPESAAVVRMEDTIVFHQYAMTREVEEDVELTELSSSAPVIMVPATRVK